jgi:hypothetical protein
MLDCRRTAGGAIGHTSPEMTFHESEMTRRLLAFASSVQPTSKAEQI